MKKFYNCPIKAAYMSKYFGVKIFYLASGTEFSLDDYFYENLLPYEADRKYYIRPDSLHIFEFTEGDFVYFKTLKRMFMISFEPTGYPSELSKKDANGKFKNELSIIQRNNLPFITPEIGE